MACDHEKASLGLPKQFLNDLNLCVIPTFTYVINTRAFPLSQQAWRVYLHKKWHSFPSSLSFLNQFLSSVSWGLQHKKLQFSKIQSKSAFYLKPLTFDPQSQGHTSLNPKFEIIPSSFTFLWKHFRFEMVSVKVPRHDTIIKSNRFETDGLSSVSMIKLFINESFIQITTRNSSFNDD